MSDAGQSGTTSIESRDPTKSPRIITQTLIEEPPLTARQHQDADKHWIGESLPSPSLIQMKPTGAASAVGSSPFPARADHQHDLSSIWGVYYSPSGVTIAPGQGFINNMTYSAGRNMLASGQMIAFPVAGMWIVQATFNISRNGGGTFVNEMNILFYYNNGGYGKMMYRTSMFDLPSTANMTITDLFTFGAVDSNSNVQFAIQHNDSVNWTCGLTAVNCVRVSSYASA